jgi:hypothetical protein
VGTVHDLRFRVYTRPGGTRACQLDTLECGGAGLGHRLGYGEHAMRGPWPFPALFRYLARRSLAVPWSQVTALSRPRIGISGAPQPAPARQRKPRMTQTGGLTILLAAWAIFGALLAVLVYFMLRHKPDPLLDQDRPVSGIWPSDGPPGGRP